MKFNPPKETPSEEIAPEQTQPTDPPGPGNNQQPKKPSYKRTYVVAGAAILIIGAAFTGYKLFANNPQPTKSDASNNQTATKTKDQKSEPVFCVKVGLSSLQCQALATKEIRKYVLPESLGEISHMTVSPDGTKYLVDAWKKTGTQNAVTSISVHDKSLKTIAQIPNPTDEGSGVTSYEIKWLDNKTLMYLTSGYETDNKSTLRTFDIAAGKESGPITLNADIERVMPSGNSRYVYGIQAEEDKAKSAVVRKLVVIDLQTKNIADVDNAVVDVNKNELTFDPSSQRFYVDTLREKEQKFNIDVYKVDNLSGKPKITATGQIKDVHTQAPRAYEVVTTDKGIFATVDSMQWKAPLKLYAENGNTTELGLGVGYYGSSIVLSLPSFPDFPTASTNKVVASDLFDPADDVPRKVVSYVTGLVDKPEGCDPGEYASYVVQAYDQDAQFSVSRAGCGLYGTAFYKAEGNSYKQIATMREGLSCEDRDMKGISAVVFPDCRKPGEGL